ncbi:DNA methyltransferase [Halarcobacter ebronensis]|uniref:site-specific DNA-methyltransferase (adenine-specific) n=1 Tax=Halarcobacter ebronensis TaxID=1462615 RepID=A0A4Q0YEU5_9BACT|nr:DNA adenine methylase [Halarcobacter ebronensis]RXJ68665.1 DNA methyltransferase [Halarcobacter ebronensis]
MKNTLPVTRYYGSKRKIINQIWEFIESENLEFDSTLDIFGGTGTFSYKAKIEGKEAHYSDIFKFNTLIGKALIQNNTHKITDAELNFVLTKDDNFNYKFFIKEIFSDIYYLEHENELIDIMVQNINRLKNYYSKYIAYYALFQTCLIKRPFNTFHRKNLNLRTNDVERQFGNKVTWEKSIEDLFRKFCIEANSYIFNNNRKNTATKSSALSCTKTADLIYIDPPYVSEKGSHVDYHSRYHFLEALVNYETFKDYVNFEKLNHEVKLGKTLEFESKTSISNDISSLIQKYNNKIIVFSYRNKGIPSIKELKNIFIENNMCCRICLIKTHSYALNKSNKALGEYLFIAKPKK